MIPVKAELARVRASKEADALRARESAGETTALRGWQDCRRRRLRPGSRNDEEL